MSKLNFFPQLGEQLMYFEQGRILGRQVLEYGAHLLLGSFIELIIVACLQAVSIGLPVLAHHDDGCR